MRVKAHGLEARATRTRGEAEAAMERRGLTLIEVLAAIAIMAVLTALALPAIESRLEGARFDAAIAGAQAAVVMARAEAQRRGVVVSLVAKPVQGGTGFFIAEAPQFSAGADAVTGSEGPSTATARASKGTQPYTAAQAGAASDALGSPSLGSASVVVFGGEKITTQAPATGQPSASSGASDVRADFTAPNAGSTASSPTDATPILIARFLPDGTAVAAGSFYVVGRSKAAQITVNRWMGSVAIKNIDLTTLEDQPTATEAPPPAGATGRTSEAGS